MKKVSIEEAVKKRYPEGVALIVCKDSKGTVDVTPIGWFMLCNSKPRCWAIALHHKHYSNKVISVTEEFVICLPSGLQKKDILYCGSIHGGDTDKLKNCKLSTIPSKKIKPPLILDSIACFECKVINSLKAPDHTIFVGEILNAYISDRTDKVYNHGDRNLFDWDIKK